MPPLSNARRPIGRQTTTPARARKGATKGVALPHERDETTGQVAVAVDPVMAQAQRDIDAGLVDTDMRSTPGLDAQRRAKLVPGPGGQPPGKRPVSKR